MTGQYKGIDLSFFPEGEIITLGTDARAISRVRKDYFPTKAGVDTSKYQITREGIYSVTVPYVAERMTRSIIDVLRDRRTPRRFQDISKLIITDATANVGGNVLNFATHFHFVNAVEIDDLTCRALENNINVYGVKDKVQVYGVKDKVRVVCADYLKVLNQLHQDVLFFDPPWGGTGYHHQSKLMLELNGNPLYQILNNLKHKPYLAVIKAPRNFDFDRFKRNVRGGVVFNKRVVTNRRLGKYLNLVFVRYPTGGREYPHLPSPSELDLHSQGLNDLYLGCLEKCDLYSGIQIIDHCLRTTAKTHGITIDRTISALDMSELYLGFDVYYRRLME